MVKYKLSSDKIGLMKYCDTYSYHIHSDELTLLERLIRYFLLLKEKIRM